MSEKKVITLADAKELLKIVPFYIEEYQDVVEHCDLYVKKVSPLFAETVVSTRPIPTSIDVLTSVAPLFIKRSSSFLTSRDPAEVNVHSALQTEFWQTFFRDCWGSELNSLIIAIFNRLRYVYVGEENLLFSNVFRQLLHTDEGDESIALYFDEDDDTNIKLVKQKLAAAYSLLHYEVSYSGFIDDWLDSMYLSGQLSLAERKKEANIYAAQDIRAELLRRKFAGTASLYSIVLSSINRRGAYAPTVSLKSVTQDGKFKDNRYIRALDLPGITTIVSNTIIDPITAFSDIIPLKTLTPLYYTSADFDSDTFLENPASYLRHRGKSFAWDNIKGILDASLVRKTYPKLDQTNPATSRLYQLDVTWVDKDQERMAKLDDSRPLFDLSIISSGFFDIQADQLLFHKNTVQRARRHEYPFLTYSISGSTGPCMMDIPWLDYIERSISRKKRIQETVGIGVQVSKLMATEALLVEEACTVLTFSETFTKDYNAQSSVFLPGMRYAYLWNLRFFYNIYTFEVKEIKKELITYILFPIAESALPQQVVEQCSSHPSYSLFTSRSVGLIPFSYPSLNTEAILSLKLKLDETGIQDDLYEEGYNKAVFLFTPYENVAIAKRYVKTEPGTLAGGDNPEWFNFPVSDEALKHVIYGISRQNKDTGKEEWFWSDPVRLYPKEVANLKTYRPDWMGMVMYINPYLTFTSNCASPLRHRQVPVRALRGPTVEQPNPEQPPVPLPKGPSEFTALCNLNVLHGMHLYCNESGEITDPNYPRGSYLRKVRPTSVTLSTEKFQIWGDNRALWGTEYAADPLDDWDNNYVRTAQYRDARGVACIKLAQGEAYQEGVPVDSYYTISPSKNAIRDEGASWADWLWNNPDNNGFTVNIDLAIENLNVDQWLLSRNEVPNNSNIHAELDFYYSADHKLILKVYPTGIASEIVLQAELSAPHILGKQSQIAASCLYEVDPSNNSKLNISLSIVADRKWTTRYYSTVKITDTSYDLYETDSSFTIEGLTPVQVTLKSNYNYELNYPSAKPYLFGMLMKYQGQSKNDLADICMLNFRRGLYPMRGLVYDFRLLNRGMSLQELIISAAGTRRELYSYSPSIYKLSYQHFTDSGVFKRFRRTSESEPEAIGKVRLFTRSVWDSILVDLYPVAEEEKTITNIRYRPDWKDPLDDTDIYDGFDYKDGVVERLLVNGYETMSGVTVAPETQLYYRGSPVYLDPLAQFSLVQTSVYPVKYSDEAFTSNLILKRDTSVTDKVSFKAYHSGINYLPVGAHSVSLPSVPSGDTLTYSLIVDVNFSLAGTLDAAAPMLRGKNILIDYDKDLSKFIVKHDIKDGAERSVVKNHLVYPLYIPNQGIDELTNSWNAKLTGFKITGSRLANALSVLLSARTYYGELQIPYAYEDDNSPTGYSYTSRWSAVKGLKDGEYYITCKYPIQILPLKNHDQARITKAPIFYAASRLKVVVKSRPKAYTESKIGNYVAKWDTDTFTPQEYIPADNRTFPHREVDIDLYVMTNIGSDSEIWQWQKIASNHDESATVQLISSTSGSLAIDKTIEFYLTNNYTAPFFIQGNTSTDVVSDVTEIKILNASGVENLEAPTIADISSLRLLSSRSYKVLFDYSAYVSELSYSSEIFTDTSKQYEEMSIAEKNNYSKLTSLLDLVNPLYDGQDVLREVAYTSRLNWSSDLLEDFNLTSTKTGYAIDSSGNWIAPNIDIINNNLALGDPYSNAVSKNLLIDIYEEQRDSIANLFYFTYRQENKDIEEIIPPQLFGTKSDRSNSILKTRTIRKIRNGGYILTPCEVNEYKALLNLYTQKIRTVQESISSLTNSTGGILEAFSTIEPILTAVGTLKKTESITPDSHVLQVYRLSSFSINYISINTPITKQGLYSTNLIATQNYLDTGFYKLEGAFGSYVYDSEKARDVVSLNTDTSTLVSLHYLKDPGSSSKYEAAISLKTPIPLEVAIQYYKPLTGAILWTSSYTSVTNVNQWDVVSWETPQSIDPGSFKILIRRPGGAAFDYQSILVSKLFIRKARYYSHVNGFSEAILATANATTLGNSKPSLSETLLVVMGRKDMATLFPIQFRNKLLRVEPKPTFLSYASTANMFISNYLPANKLQSTEELVELIRPWTRRIVFKEDNPRSVSVYRYINSVNGAEFSKTSSIGDIFEVYNDFEDEANRSIRYNALYNDVEFAGRYGLVLNTSRLPELLDTNLQLEANTIPVLDERFSLISGCVNPEKFIAGESSVVAITNIQLLNNSDDDPAILYEFEYLPIIYDESRHHLSMNFLLRSN